MGNAVEDEFVNELIFCIGENDIIKGQAVLQYFPDMPSPIQHKALFEISRAPDTQAYLLLEQLFKVEHDDPYMYEKIYELTLDKSIGKTDRILRYVKSADEQMRTIYIRIAGDLRAKDAVPGFLELLGKETDPFFLSELICSLGKIGDPSAIDGIADFIYYGDDVLKKTAVQALEHIGGTSAFKRLAEASSTSKHDEFIAEVLDRMLAQMADMTLEMEIIEPHEDDSLDVTLNDQLKSQIPEDRIAAYELIMEKGADLIPAMGKNLTLQDHDWLINSLRLMGHWGDKTAMPEILKLLKSNPKDPDIRFAAYAAIERLPSSKSILDVINGLEDSAEIVRMAAAKAMDKNLSEVLVAGLRSKIDVGGAKSQKIVSAVIDTVSENTFKTLLLSDVFTLTAGDYLTQDISPKIRKPFLEILKTSGNKSLARRIEIEIQAKDMTDYLLAYVVEPSKLVRRIYEKKCYKIGIEPIFFNSGEEMLDALDQRAPDLAFWPLIMRPLNGLMLAVQLRASYNSKHIPIFLLTLQQDFIDQAQADGSPSEVFLEAGINKIFPKFFDAKKLLKAIKELGIKPRANREKAAEAAKAEAQSEITGLIEMLSAPQAEIRNSVVYELVDAGAGVVPPLLAKLNPQDTDLCINTLKILGAIRDEAACDPIWQLLKSKPADSDVRFSAYEALTHFLTPETVIKIIDGLEDSSEQVRMAATWSINNNFTTELVPELRSRIDTGTGRAKAIVAALIDTECDVAFKALLQSDSFTTSLSDHLAQDIHPALRNHFLDILINSGNKSMARRIQHEAPEVSLQDYPIAFVVDDSDVMLKYYAKKLYKAKYNPLLFNSAEAALETALESKPHLIVTGLIMPGLNGIELAKAIRRKYDARALPIILITTQKHFTPETDDASALEPLISAGINVILHTSFKERELTAVINELNE